MKAARHRDKTERDRERERERESEQEYTEAKSHQKEKANFPQHIIFATPTMELSWSSPWREKHYSSTTDCSQILP